MQLAWTLRAGRVSRVRCAIGGSEARAGSTSLSCDVLGDYSGRDPTPAYGSWRFAARHYETERVLARRVLLLRPLFATPASASAEAHGVPTRLTQPSPRVPV